MEELRDGFHLEGFRLPTEYAAIVCDVCDHEFSPAEFIAEQDALALNIVRSPCLPGFPERPSGLFARFLNRTRDWTIESLINRVSVPIIAAKIGEMGDEPRADPILTKSAELQAYASDFGRELGFAKHKGAVSVLPQSMFKRTPRLGLHGYYGLGAGSAKQSYRRDTDIRFLICLGPFAGTATPIDLESIIRGVGFYARVEGSVRPSIPELTFDSLLVSSTAKWGIQAQLTLFDMFLRSLDKLELF